MIHIASSEDGNDKELERAMVLRQSPGIIWSPAAKRSPDWSRLEQSIAPDIRPTCSYLYPLT